jgi:hypothetical protein
MDPPGESDLSENAVQDVMENVQKARTMGLVEGIREATTGHEIDAEGQPLDLDLLRDLIYETQGREHVQREELLLAMHPAQQYILREDDDMRLLAGKYADDLTHGSETTHFQGIPLLVDATLPKAVVYLVPPNSITVGGTVLHPDRVGRLTGLKHPSAYCD